MPFPVSTREELQQLRSPNARVLAALDDHALPEVIAASTGLSMLQTLRILQAWPSATAKNAGVRAR